MMAIDKISNNSHITASNDRVAHLDDSAVRAKKASDAKSASSSTPSDNVTITNSAALLQKWEQNIAQMPIVDMQKVEQIQKAIKDNSYSINSGKIADKFIDMEIALSRSS